MCCQDPTKKKMGNIKMHLENLALIADFHELMDITHKTSNELSKHIVSK